jgi:hypothetical protein
VTKRADPSRLRTPCASVSRSHVRLRNIKFCVCSVGQRRSHHGIMPVIKDQITTPPAGIMPVRALHLTGVLPPRWPTFALVTDRKSLLPGRPPGAQLTCVAPVKWRPQMPVMQVIEAQLRLDPEVVPHDHLHNNQMSTSMSTTVVLLV